MRDAQPAVGPVDVLQASRVRPCVNVDTAIGGLGSGVVHSRDRAPEGDPARVVREIQVQRLFSSDRWIIGRHTFVSGDAVFRCGIGVVPKTPIASSAISALSHGDDFATHV